MRVSIYLSVQLSKIHSRPMPHPPLQTGGDKVPASASVLPLFQRRMNKTTKVEITSRKYIDGYIAAGSRKRREEGWWSDGDRRKAGGAARTTAGVLPTRQDNTARIFSYFVLS
ncbi:hypothetical protein GWI33_010413 [Rhynchophorus ferrugineus]|uniref:Uncharacterized protein n=1 Tax=Rhynchophorus ferrugineus TaxID=354439 RepID=A0A834IXE5_RHYFE|nr:hypothetical protein GWI33_010413 [Rhynchophorus ferrugineus]